MGRKSIEKDRIDDSERKLEWAEKAFPILQSRGLKGLSMEELASEIGVSKATLYKYFSSREELVRLITQSRLDSMRDFVMILNDHSLPYPERYKKCMMLVANAMDGVSNLFLSDLKLAHPTIWKLLDDLIEFSLKVLEAYYAVGIKEGYLNAVSPALLAHTDRILFQTLSDPDFLQPNNLTVKEAFSQYFTVKFVGAMKNNHPARELIIQ